MTRLIASPTTVERLGSPSEQPAADQGPRWTTARHRRVRRPGRAAGVLPARHPRFAAAAAAERGGRARGRAPAADVRPSRVRRLRPAPGPPDRRLRARRRGDRGHPRPRPVPRRGWLRRRPARAGRRGAAGRPRARLSSAGSARRPTTASTSTSWPGWTRRTSRSSAGRWSRRRCSTATWSVRRSRCSASSRTSPRRCSARSTSPPPTWQLIARTDVQTSMGEMVAEAFRTGVWGWVDDDLAMVEPWGFDLDEITVPGHAPLRQRGRARPGCARRVAQPPRPGRPRRGRRLRRAPGLARDHAGDLRRSWPRSGDERLAQRNVLGGELEPCGNDPVTGFYRDGCCTAGPEDVGSHTICAVVTTEFLEHQRSIGNDLATPMRAVRLPRPATPATAGA